MIHPTISDRSYQGATSRSNSIIKTKKLFLKTIYPPAAILNIPMMIYKN